MTVYLDDRFFDHPKAVTAGEDACLVYIASLAYSSREHTRGFIPAGALPRLTAKANRKALAGRLVTAGLWTTADGGWLIHDYQERNAKQIAQREKASNAARARWKNAPSNAPSMPEHCSGDANKNKEQRTKNSTLVVLETHEDIHNPVDDDDQAGIVEAALRLLATRDLMRREGEVGPVGDREAWFKRAVEARRERHAAAIADALGAFSWRPDKLADFLEPPLKSSEGPLEATAAAQAAIIERNEQRRQGAPR